MPGCGCGAGSWAFRTERGIKFNNDSTISGSALVNRPRALLRTGKNVMVADGSMFFGDRMILGNATSAWSLTTNLLRVGQSVTVRGGSMVNPPVTGPLPAVSALCGNFPGFSCGGPDVRALTGETIGPLPPGSYGRVLVMNGADLILQPGTYQFCDVKMGRDARIDTQGATTINVVSNVTVGSGSYLGPQTANDDVTILNVLGTKVRVSQGATMQAAVDAPYAKLTFGRDSTLLGCFCGQQMKSDKHITLVCTE